MTRSVNCVNSTPLAEMDFEAYSEAGYYFDDSSNRRRPINPSPPYGLPAVGAAVYSEHPSTEILSLAYDLKDNQGARLWIPGAPAPTPLFEHIAAGRLIEAWNSMFEYLIWKNVCTARLGWPELPLGQLRDAMAKARAHALPGALENAAVVVGAPVLKIADGKRLIRKFCIPHTPTKKDPRRRIYPAEEPDDAAKLYQYNVGDIKAEAAVSALVPDLTSTELNVWLTDQQINARGVAVDTDGLTACKKIIGQARVRGEADIQALTAGQVQAATEIQKIRTWTETRGVVTPTLDKAAVAGLLGRQDIPPDVRRVLEVRASLGAASVNKLFAMERRLSRDGRIRDLFRYYGAERTGRWAGRGVQPQNLPGGGPAVRRCACGRHFAAARFTCPWCGGPGILAPIVKWRLEAVQDALYVIESGSVLCVEYFFGDAVAAVAGCLRGLLCAAPGHELISSDYSAIEAVVLAALAGEEWRLEVFRTHGMNYETAASKITGVPFAEFVRHRAETGEHHPLRKLGKVAELASGYQGSVGAWKAFGADKHFASDDEILAAVRAWRAASPKIVDFWYRLQDAATAAIKQPGKPFRYRDISYGVQGDILYCQLPSGRLLKYHTPRLVPEKQYEEFFDKKTGKKIRSIYRRNPGEKIIYTGWNTDYTKGKTGWIWFDTYGGKLAENVTQAAARDIQAHGMIGLEAAGYPIVLHVHDESVSEVPTGFGSIEEYETIMCNVPPWAAAWPICAGGGWRGQRYRKD